MGNSWGCCPASSEGALLSPRVKGSVEGVGMETAPEDVVLGEMPEP